MEESRRFRRPGVRGRPHSDMQEQDPDITPCLSDIVEIVTSKYIISLG